MGMFNSDHERRLQVLEGIVNTIVERHMPASQTVSEALNVKLEMLFKMFEELLTRVKELEKHHREDSERYIEVLDAIEKITTALGPFIANKNKP
jgi:hypothetical protein